MKTKLGSAALSRSKSKANVSSYHHNIGAFDVFHNVVTVYHKTMSLVTTESLKTELEIFDIPYQDDSVLDKSKLLTKMTVFLIWIEALHGRVC